AARDPLELIDEKMQQRILQARRAFAGGLPEDLRGAVEFFDPERCNAAASVQENVLFGTIVRGESGSRELVHAAITEVLDELGLRRVLIEVGLTIRLGPEALGCRKRSDKSWQSPMQYSSGPTRWRSTIRQQFSTGRPRPSSSNV